MTERAADPHILVGVDGSASALRAVRWAAHEAQRRRVSLMIAHVVESTSFAHGSPPPSPNADQAGAVAHDVVAAADYRVEKHFPAVTTCVTVLAGDPADELVALSADAMITVVGASGTGGVRAAVFGSVAMTLITRGHSPIAVIRVPEYYGAVEPGAVVVGVDGTECSTEAVAWAFDEAARRRAPLVAVHTVGAQERLSLTDHLAGWEARYPEVGVSRVVREGRPADELIETARDAQLLVVGSRGHGERSGILFDSVTRTLIHHAPCSVLVARNGRTSGRDHGRRAAQ